MKLNEEEKRMVYQIESTNQNAALNEIYMTWRYTRNQATKDTAESLLKKLRPLSDKECMDVIRHCPEYKAFYDKKFAEVRTHQHKRALALTSRKLIRMLFGLLANGKLYSVEKSR